MPVVLGSGTGFSPSIRFRNAVARKIFTAAAFKVAQKLMADRPLTRKCFTLVFRSYSDIVASIPDRNRYLSLNAGVFSWARRFAKRTALAS